MSDNISFNPASNANISSASFKAGIVKQHISGALLDQMIEGNIKDQTLAPIKQLEADDASALAQGFRKLKAPKKSDKTNLDEVKKITAILTKVFSRKEEAQGFANQFSNREANRPYRLNPSVLTSLAFDDLGEVIHGDLEPDEIVAIVKKKLSDMGESEDPSIVNKCLEFLVEVSRAQSNNPAVPNEKKEIIANILIKLEVTLAHYQTDNAKIIEEGSNIIGAVDAVVEATQGETKVVLSRYRDVIHTNPDIFALLLHYESNGGYEAMEKEFKGLRGYLNKQLKLNGIENAEMGQLINTVRKLQAIHHVLKEALNQNKRFLPGYFRANNITIEMHH